MTLDTVGLRSLSQARGRHRVTRRPRDPGSRSALLCIQPSRSRLFIECRLQLGELQRHQDVSGEKINSGLYLDQYQVARPTILDY